MINSDLDHALPVFEWTSISFVTGTAGSAPLHNIVFPPESSVPVAAGWTANGDDRSTCGWRNMGWASIAANEKPGGFAKRDEFFERRGDFPHNGCFFPQASDE